ncbi:hypothetical protein [Corallococcus sp. EGB]|uniref:hypothetical protein n=1 Tax=Corallococcus sp. EGB TaxID=1521117 RepID=UPI001CBAF322|nr:hypothetical protein [Corallococcus sp. EGB]
MAADESGGPSFLARLVLVLLGFAFLGAAWVWHQKDRDPKAARLIERVSGGRVRGGAARP